jgi:inosine-uridine nucleoside N-ribohydrolase
MAGEVETRGELTRGATIFDRRRVPAWRCNMEVVQEIDAAKVTQAIVDSLAAAGRATMEA